MPEFSIGQNLTNTGVGAPLVEVPETRTYRSADGSQSRRYRAGDLVHPSEFAFLRMDAPIEVGELAEEADLSVDPDSPVPGVIETIVGPLGEGIQITDPSAYESGIVPPPIAEIAPDSPDAIPDPTKETPVVDPEPTRDEVTARKQAKAAAVGAKADKPAENKAEAEPEQKSE